MWRAVWRAVWRAPRRATECAARAPKPRRAAPRVRHDRAARAPSSQSRRTFCATSNAPRVRLCDFLADTASKPLWSPGQSLNAGAHEDLGRVSLNDQVL